MNNNKLLKLKNDLERKKDDLQESLSKYKRTFYN